MPEKRIHKLGDLQLRIMQSLWARTEAAVGDVQADLGGSDQFAYTTIATMLRKMEARGLVAHRTQGRTFLYQAQVAENEVSRGLTDHLVERIFEGSLTQVVSHLLTTREVSRKELAELERLIAERKKKL